MSGLCNREWPLTGSVAETCLELLSLLLLLPKNIGILGVCHRHQLCAPFLCLLSMVLRIDPELRVY